MRTSGVDFGGRLPVEGYGPGFFRVGGEVCHGPLALMPSGPVAWAGLPDIETFIAAADGIDLLFLGMGPEIRPLPVTLRERIEAAGLGVEVMATAPACRSYNVLLAEGRRIAAGLMPV